MTGGPLLLVGNALLPLLIVGDADLGIAAAGLVWLVIGRTVWDTVADSTPAFA